MKPFPSPRYAIRQPNTGLARTGRVAGLYANRYSKAFQGISLEDYLLAATARTHRCPLWTRNRKHYPMDDIEIITA